MSFKATLQSILMAALVAASLPACAQTENSADADKLLPVFVGGGGGSYYNVDWGRTRMEGVTLWGDWYPHRVPEFLRGIAVEGEVRDIRFHSGDKPPDFQQFTMGGGLIYTWRHFKNFHPYGKALVDLGVIDFGGCYGNCSSSPFNGNQKLAFAPGIGFEYRVRRHWWARADYEYQDWQDVLGTNKTLNPQGFTVGAMYDFTHYRRQK